MREIKESLQYLKSVLIPLSSSPIIIPKTFPLLTRLLNGDRLIDLLLHLPHSYIDRSYCPKIQQAQLGRVVTLSLKIEQHIPNKRKGSPYQIIASDETGYLNISFFNTNRSYIEKILPIGSSKIISGKVDLFNHKLQMAHPDYILDPQNKSSIPLIEPVYPLCTGITNKYLQKLVQYGFSILHSSFLETNWGMAFRKLHLCKTTQELKEVEKERLIIAFDELSAHQIALQVARQKSIKKQGLKFVLKNELALKCQQSLPFQLTTDQEKAFQDIQQDVVKDLPMRRLLQGDVGSGKTIIAFLGMLLAIENGYQATVMAPTEILARQHFVTFKEWEETLGIAVDLLTGSEKGKKRNTILEKLEKGQIDILIGTHALFEDPVRFKNLGFVVIDEQHRYGVEQRLKLLEKGNSPHLLLMSATPIPRTLQMAFYGDLDISSIRTKPIGRKSIQTKAMSLERMNEVIEGLQRCIHKGEQVYWICPLIHESEVLDLAAAEDRYQDLQKYFGERVGLIHGQIESKEKEKIIDQFQKSEIQILVSTTVVEVGINVLKATTIIIEHAERFGLSQLHQLRGRVGRSDFQSFCILLYAVPLTPHARHRIEVMRSTDDGFQIAEEDLKLRGAGDLLGREQSGTKEFKIARFPEDNDLLIRAHQRARDYMFQSTSEDIEWLRFLAEAFNLSGSSKKIQS